ncbi:hypothetical protein Hanom_Chr01g00021711 [Helianthus anomalus]
MVNLVHFLIFFDAGFVVLRINGLCRSKGSLCSLKSATLWSNHKGTTLRS